MIKKNERKRKKTFNNGKIKNLIERIWKNQKNIKNLSKKRK